MTAAVFHMELRAGVRQHLNGLTSLPPVAWEGKAFAPVRGQAFVSEVMVPVSSAVRGTGRGGYIAHTVMANFTLHHPANAGTSAIETLAGRILQHFAPGTAIAYGSSSAIVQEAEVAGLIQEPDWVSMTVAVNMVGHTTN